MIDWKPAAATKAVLITVDAHYLPYAACLAWQIASQSGVRDFDILIASEKPLALPDVLIELGVKSLVLALGTDLAAMPERTHPRSAYLRLEAPEVLAHRYARLLYLDADILFEGGDLSRLMDIDLQGAGIGAVCDVKAFVKQRHLAKEFRLMGWAAAPYLNAGVLLFDTADFLAQKIPERMAEIAAKTDPTIFIYQDQTLLNLALHGDFAELSPIWNWQMNPRVAASGESARIPVVLRHFITKKKPFLTPGRVTICAIARSIGTSFAPSCRRPWLRPASPPAPPVYDAVGDHPAVFQRALDAASRRSLLVPVPE